MDDLTRAARPEPTSLAAETGTDMALKEALEAALRARPSDRALRAQYFAQLRAISGSHAGLCRVHLPELTYPLVIRCGTSDAQELQRIFQGEVYAFPVARAPRRILDLGAYAGYAAAYLAHRFPQAEILCVEPNAGNYRTLLMNTLPCSRIAHLAGAVWHESARLRPGRANSDAEHIYGEAEPAARDTVAGYSMADLLRFRGWTSADFIKCTIEGAERTVFANPDAPWLSAMNVLAITARDAESEARVEASIGLPAFETMRNGRFTVHRRRDPKPDPEAPRLVPLFDAGQPLRPVRRNHVGQERWSCQLLDDRTWQLHPNPPDAPPAELIFPYEFDGQSRFVAQVALEAPGSADVIFRVLIRRAADGAILLDAARRLSAGQRGTWSEHCPLLNGRHEVVLRTEMAPGATTNQHAWARWIDPRFG